jgi:NAD(P)-dependent dehydrogenase (short-subunit alcohol dehydrogenase family)
MKGVKGKVALVTGGSSGIGRAAAQIFGREGAKVVIASRNSGRGEEAVKAIKSAGGEAIFIKTDVTSSKEVQSLVNQIVKTYGRLDIAFNNAGIAGKLDATANTTEEDWDISMNVNLRSVFLCMKYELIQMLKQGGGAIVNTASAAGLVALPGAVAYNVAKWGTVGLTKTAAIDYVKSNIRVNCVCPSFVKTPITDGLAKEYPEMIQKMFPYQPIGRLGLPEEIGEAVVWLSSEDASFVTGAAFSIDGGYVAM